MLQLDVYKRQHDAFDHRVPGNGNDNGQAENGQREVFRLSLIHISLRIMLWKTELQEVWNMAYLDKFSLAGKAVSYTHLDVYKRQV